MLVVVAGALVAGLGLVLDMDRMIGGDFAAGLADPKREAERRWP
ncbi:MAG TPA: hypothetical protein PKA13_24845 [Geminicoccaceae bacterium]|nr:hypothetical protein [Geminicoccus sp.]HMU53027.1 hypothetical protein [Geminicoccaceae bacterium]